jgi:pyridoxamine 5'-phosphate oxidase
MVRVVATRPRVSQTPTLGPVDERALDRDAVTQVVAWLDEARAAGVAFPETMTVATASPEGAPSARMVLLKGADQRGFVFFTNRESRKGRELAANPRAALVLYWQALGRQVRIEGRVEEASAAESESYWRTRPRGSQLSAAASPQSEPVGDRHTLELRRAEIAAEHPDGVPLPEFWGGYRVVPETIELWEHRDDRLHDRVLYTRDGEGWRMKRLAP